MSRSPKPRKKPNGHLAEKVSRVQDIARKADHQVLASIRTPLQYLGLAMIVAAGVASRVVPSAGILGALVSGYIGFYLLVLGLVLPSIQNYPRSHRAIFVTILNGFFTVGLLALCLLLMMNHQDALETSHGLLLLNKSSGLEGIGNRGVSFEGGAHNL